MMDSFRRRKHWQPNVRSWRPKEVMHTRGDVPVPFSQGQEIVAGIPGAKFVPLESRNHFILADEPANRNSSMLSLRFWATGAYGARYRALRHSRSECRGVFQPSNEIGSSRRLRSSLPLPGPRSPFSPGCTRDFRVKMWGTSSPGGKLAGDLGNVFEATRNGDRRSDRLLAGKLSSGNIGLLQQNRHFSYIALWTARSQLAKADIGPKEAACH